MKTRFEHNRMRTEGAVHVVDMLPCGMVHYVVEGIICRLLRMLGSFVYKAWKAACGRLLLPQHPHPYTCHFKKHGENRVMSAK
jgi:hypothetical protein